MQSPDCSRVRLSSLTSQSHLSNSLSPHRSGHPHSPFLPPLLGLPPRPSLLGEDPNPRISWKGSELAFVWTYCSVPLFTQSLKLYVLLSLNCIGLCCPLVSQYHLSDDISSSIQQGISRCFVGELVGMSCANLDLQLFVIVNLFHG